MGNGAMVQIEAPALGESCRQQLLPVSSCHRAHPRLYFPTEREETKEQKRRLRKGGELSRSLRAIHD